MELEIRQLSTSESSFEDELNDILSRGSEFDPDVDRTVRRIIENVRSRGDEALLECTREYDRNHAKSASDLEIHSQELQNAANRIQPEVLEAIQFAANRVRRFHERQMETSWTYEEDDGSRYGQQLTPIEKVGVYVPGGRAAYPSSVLMTAVPAKVAGVSQIVMTVPATEGEIRDSVLAAAHVAGVDRVFAIGGAQAIAALAFGTKTVPRVDKIVGPGNAWVSAAKRQVFGHVGIDLIAGPSEVVVVCDDSADANWVAMDLFAQAEHDQDAQSILICTSYGKIEEVRKAMQEELPGMERKDIIARALAKQGALIHVRSQEELIQLVNRLAPEHLELMVENPSALVGKIRNAGAIFVGCHSAEVLGDYCAGPNHVLPTSGAARFSSPLGVYDYLKRTSLISCSPEGSRRLARTASILAREEQLTAHARSAEYREQ